jgi:hypothetical protein
VESLTPEGEGSLAGCLDAAQDRSLPPQQERHLSMLHTIKPFYDNNKKGEQHDTRIRTEPEASRRATQAWMLNF